MSSEEKSKFEYKNSPMAWFCVLEAARTQGDYVKAAKAQDELRRLGIEVRYCIQVEVGQLGELKCP